MHPDKLENQTILHYKIYEQLGQGAMGIVYRAEDMDLERIVALKVLAPAQISQEKSARERFLREARAAAKINHP
ncbi:serine/threonine protein kinase, partial [bacterium]|nr:serine/threonine protein kinase [bacterium]